MFWKKYIIVRRVRKFLKQGEVYYFTTEASTKVFFTSAKSVSLEVEINLHLQGTNNVSTKAKHILVTFVIINQHNRAASGYMNNLYMKE